MPLRRLSVALVLGLALVASACTVSIDRIYTDPSPPERGQPFRICIRIANDSPDVVLARITMVLRNPASSGGDIRAWEGEYDGAEVEACADAPALPAHEYEVLAEACPVSLATGQVDGDCATARQPVLVGWTYREWPASAAPPGQPWITQLQVRPRAPRVDEQASLCARTTASPPTEASLLVQAGNPDEVVSSSLGTTPHLGELLHCWTIWIRRPGLAEVTVAACPPGVDPTPGNDACWLRTLWIPVLEPGERSGSGRAADGSSSPSLRIRSVEVGDGS